MERYKAGAAASARLHRGGGWVGGHNLLSGRDDGSLVVHTPV